MTCGFCGNHLKETEHRCGLCGRKPGDILVPAVQGSLATYAVPAADATGVPGQAEPRLPRPVQGRLFSDGNVIRFPAGGPQKSGKGGGKRNSRPAPESQGFLDLVPAEPTAPVLNTRVEAKICCDARVAARSHRIVASAFDWSMVLIGYGFFLTLYRLVGGEFALTRAAIGGYIGGLALLGVAYGIIWTIAGTETAGMRLTGLCLLTFDGFRPEPKQRRIRFLGACLSVGTGVGMLWPLGDEEGLTWADHISGTFPTPAAAGAEVLQLT
jgi:uncharacterized RDD family membrane protein YckC